jgi:hypothetical protein
MKTTLASFITAISVSLVVLGPTSALAATIVVTNTRYYLTDWSFI